MLADEVWDAAGVRRAPYVIVDRRDGRPRRGAEARRSARRRVVGRRPRRLQRRRQLRPLGGDGATGRRRSGSSGRAATGCGCCRSSTGSRARSTGSCCRTAPRHCDRSRSRCCATSGARAFVYGGLSTFWDPPDADREEMRAAVRRVGRAPAGGARLPRRLRHRRGAHRRGVPAHRAQHPDVRGRDGGRGGGPACFFMLLQANLVAGGDTGLGAADVESLVALMDAERTGKAVAFAEGPTVGGSHSCPCPGTAPRSTGPTEETGNVLSSADTPTGMFAKVDPCVALAPGDRRLADVNVALMDFSTETRELRCRGFGDLRRAAPDLPGPDRPRLGFSAWRGWWWSVAASAASPRPRGWPSSATRSPSSSASGALGGALSTVSVDGFTWDAGPDLDGAARGAARPVPQVRAAAGARARPRSRSTSCASTASRTARSLPLPGGSRGGADGRLRRPGPGPRPAVGGPRASFADDWEVLRRGYLEVPWRPGRLPREVAAAARQPRDAGQAAPSGLPRRAAATGRRHPFWPRHDLRNVPAWSG